MRHDQHDDTAPSTALTSAYVNDYSHVTNDDAIDAEDAPHRGAPDAQSEFYHWRPALTRWLLTLNPGRTQDEYEKAARYFFETPGAPQTLGEITYDALLAYRGALALRADRRRRSVPRQAALASWRRRLQQPQWQDGASHAYSALGPGNDRGHGPSTTSASAAAQRQGPLSPATVNLRLTALRQFLAYCSVQDLLRDLTTERIRVALRRLTTERRRPYQILAEEEWREFLEVARTPATAPSTAASQPLRPSGDATPVAGSEQPSVARGGDRGPWGVTRAERERLKQERAAQASATQASAAQASAAHDPASDGEGADPAARADTPLNTPAETRPETRLGRAHDGRTGAHTAQRDYALVALALATGLRAIELSLLDVGDLVSERRRGQVEWWLVLPDEKTKGQRGGRSLPLAPDLVETLLSYIMATGRAWDDRDDRETPLFLALQRGRAPALLTRASQDDQRIALQFEDRRTYRRLRPEQIRSVINRVETQWLERRRAASGESSASNPGGESRRISPHALRHSAAVALLLGSESAGRPPASVEHVRGWLGHFDIRTTQRYLAHLESREQRRQFAISPLNPSAVTNQTQPSADGTAKDTSESPAGEPAGEGD